MSDKQENEQVNDDAAQAAIEAEARRMGWVEKEAYRGPADNWRDAASFVQRGKEILPIVQATNKKLESAVEALRADLAAALAGNKELRDSIGALNEYHEENLKEQVARVKAGLLDQIKQAKKDGDVDREVELGEELQELREKEKKVSTAEKKPEAKPDPKPAAKPTDPAFDEWRAKPENAWFGTDKRKTGMALVLGKEVAEEMPHLLNADSSATPAFYLEVAKRVEEVFAPRQPKTDKVNGSRPGGGKPGGGGKTFEDLPDDAKAACARFADRVVGPNKAHKDLKSWQSKYATDYFKQFDATT